MDGNPEKTPPVGEAVKATQRGALPIGTVEQILEAAPNDIIEETLPIPEWGVAVKVRSLTGIQAAAVREASVEGVGESARLTWDRMEITQFQMTVIEPAFTEEQVRELYSKSGRGFQRVIKWADEKGEIDKEALKKARDEFRAESDEPAPV
jgi:hypothetical protein